MNMYQSHESRNRKRQCSPSWTWIKPLRRCWIPIITIVVSSGYWRWKLTDSVCVWLQYFVQAWNSACYSTGGQATILVPKGYSFVMQDMMVFSGKKCLSSITFQVSKMLRNPSTDCNLACSAMKLWRRRFSVGDGCACVQVDGTMLGPSKWKGKASTSSWMQFQDCKDFTLQGKGTLYARGESFWSSTKGGPCVSPGSVLPLAILLLENQAFLIEKFCSMKGTVTVVNHSWKTRLTRFRDMLWNVQWLNISCPCWIFLTVKG